MVNLSPPKRVKVICGFIYKEESIYLSVKKIIKQKLGKIDYESEKLNFNFTDYYYEEIGEPLWRRFISLKKLNNPSASKFVKMKLWCIKLEKKFSSNNKRQINIDPGYLNLARLVLLTTKDFSHRIYLDKGIYAEVTLHYSHNNYNDFAWTYPDYRTKEYKNIFLKVRQIYKAQLKDEK